MAKNKKYTIDGLEVTVDPDKLKRWTVVDLTERIQSGEESAIIPLMRAIFGNNLNAILNHLDPEENDPDLTQVYEFFEKLVEEMGKDVSKN